MRIFTSSRLLPQKEQWRVDFAMVVVGVETCQKYIKKAIATSLPALLWHQATVLGNGQE
jgi:hypothetical protein